MWRATHIRLNRLSSRFNSPIGHAPRTLSSQVILKECDDALSKRSNVTIRKDRVYHLLNLLETPLDHRPLWAELSSYLLPGCN